MTLQREPLPQTKATLKAAPEETPAHAPHRPDSTELAWAAGVYDLRGYVQDKNRTLYLRVGFPFGEAKARRFAMALGVGKVYGPYRSKKLPKGPVWQYELIGRAKVKGVLEKLLPYLTDPASVSALLKPKEAPPEEAASSSLIEGSMTPDTPSRWDESPAWEGLMEEVIDICSDRQHLADEELAALIAEQLNVCPDTAWKAGKEVRFCR